MKKSRTQDRIRNAGGNNSDFVAGDAPVNPQMRRLSKRGSGKSSWSQNYLLDRRSHPDTEHEFSRTISMMSRGELKAQKKDYDSFREYLWAKPFLNPAIGNAHITAGYDYHMKELQRYWGPTKMTTSSDNEQRKHTQQVSKSKDRLLGDPFGPVSTVGDLQPYYKEGSVKVFGRNRVIRPFARFGAHQYEHKAPIEKVCINGNHQYNMIFIILYIHSDNLTSVYFFS